MEQQIYTYEFNPISNKWTSLRVHNSLVPTLAELHVCIRDSILSLRTVSSIPLIIADLLDIAVAVHVGDRVSEKQEGMTCKIQIILPIRCPEVFKRTEVYAKLKEILFWYTGYIWEFEFKQRLVEGRKSEQLLTLPLKSEDPIIVSLWSGGLDALAGLYWQLKQFKDTNHVLASSGNSSFIYGKQQEISQRVESLFPNRTLLIRVPIGLKHVDGELPRKPSLRSRGFVFMMVGAAVAYLMGQTTLYIYENGIGAINLPFRPSEVGLDHARSVHPLSLLYLSEFISLVLEQPFSFQNPFLFQTKAEICRSLINDGLVDLACETVTCDRRHRKKEAQQCGRCSSCVLRRQMFEVMGVEDKTNYVFSDFDVSSVVKQLSKDDHLPAMLYQVETLRTHLNAENPWRAMSRQFETLSFDIADQTAAQYGLTSNEMQERLLRLYRQYVYEWDFIRQLRS